MIESFRTLAKVEAGRPVKKSRKPTIITDDSGLTSIRGTATIRYVYRARKSGAGIHANKADKRCRTRGNQLKKAIEDAS